MTHLVECRDLFFLEEKIIDNVFQWDVPKNMRHTESYDDMFQAIRALTVQKILKIIILTLLRTGGGGLLARTIGLAARNLDAFHVESPKLLTSLLCYCFF